MRMTAPGGGSARGLRVLRDQQADGVLAHGAIVDDLGRPSTRTHQSRVQSSSS